MTEAEEKKLEIAEREDKARRDGQDEEIPAWADSLLKSHKELTDRLDAMSKEYGRPAEAADKARKDKDAGEDPTETTEGKRKDAARKDEESEEERKKREAEGGHKANEEEVAEKARKERERDDARRKDARRDTEGDTDNDTDREDRARKDAAIHAISRAQEAKIRELESRLNAVYREPSIEDRNALADIRLRADSLYQSLSGHPASQPMPDESPIAYRKRMADGLRKYSDKMKDVRLDGLSGGALDVIEAQIYNDAAEALKSPAIVQAGQLRAITRNDAGHTITEYVGDPAAAWANFSVGASQVVKLTRPAAVHP